MNDPVGTLSGEEGTSSDHCPTGLVSGHDFSRADKANNTERALAPANRGCMPRFKAVFVFAVSFLALTAATACHSYHVETTVENRTGAPIQLLEVDYPSASFGADALAAGAVFHYRIQLLGSGPLKVQYTVGEGHQVQNTGPTLAERQEGKLQIVLLPEGKAEFHPDLSPPR